MKIQKRDLETGDTKPQGSATLKDTAFDIISLNDNAVLVEGKLYKKNEVVKTIHTDIEGVASTSSDLLPYGKFRIVESEAPDGYLTDGAKPIDFTITENGKIVDLTDEAHSIYNQIKRGDIEGVKIGAGTHKRLANVPFIQRMANMLEAFHALDQFLRGGVREAGGILNTVLGVQREVRLIPVDTAAAGLDVPLARQQFFRNFLRDFDHHIFHIPRVKIPQIDFLHCVPPFRCWGLTSDRSEGRRRAAPGLDFGPSWPEAKQKKCARTARRYADA